MNKETIMSVLLMLSALLLVCKATQPECIQGDLRLTELVETNTTDGTVRNVTFVEYCFTTGSWRVICNHPVSWTQSAAVVICRQLGYSDKDVSYGVGCYGNMTRTSIELKNECTENRLSCCKIFGKQECNCGEHAWVACESACINGALRLVDGANHREGRVEVCVDGRWGTVCKNSQEGITGAVCAELGFLAEGAHMIITIHGPDTRSMPIASCAVQSSGLTCAEISDVSCDHTMDIGVVCQGSTGLPGGCKDCPNITLAKDCPTISQPADCPTVAMNEGSLTAALGAVIGILVVLQVITLTGWIVTCFSRKRLMGSIRQRSPTHVKTGRNDSYHLHQINTQETSNEATPTQADQSTYNHTYDSVADRIDVGYAEIGLKQQAPPTVQPEHVPVEASKKGDDFYNAEEHTYAMIDKKKAKKAPKDE